MLPKPKKSLGQNFLVDQNIQRKIVAACDLRITDTVLEIGAGTGAITGPMSRKAQRVYAVEIDKTLCDTLKENLGTHKNAVVIHADILATDLYQHFSPLERKIKVIGNIPYYITTPILEHLLKFRSIIHSIYLLVQKEFAQRMAAEPGSKEYGSFSCFVQYYTEPEILFPVKKNSFFPAPKVDSCFLKLAVRERPAVIVRDEERLFKIIRTAFGQRRKMLSNSLKAILSRDHLSEFFSRYSINPKVRAEELSLQDFANLANLQ